MRALALVAGVAVHAVVLIACDGAAEPPFLPETSPAPTAENTLVPEPRPTAALTPTPTLPPASGGIDGFRAFAALIDEALGRDDSQWFIDRTLESQVECTEPNALGAGPCADYPTVTVESGVWSYLWGSDARGLVSPERIGSKFELLASTAESAESDAFGTGEATLYALGRSPSGIFPGLDQGSFSAILTGILSVREGPEGLEELESPSRRITAYQFVFVDGAWRLVGVIDAGDTSLGPAQAQLAEDWLSGECDFCYDYWERWEGIP